jgi:cyclic pyranopterin phosphate synthase
MFVDRYERKINYLRLAVTDRCNLRCTYCMPGEGIEWLPCSEILTNEEMLRICSLLVKRGIEKIRITGGEPFVRKGLLPFLRDLSLLNGLKHLTLTTNGVLTAPFIPELKKIGIRFVNLSLDTLDRDRFIQIARRDELEKVLATLDSFLRHGMEVKINAVVMEKLNISDIIPLVQMTKDLPIGVRFIEEMPFNGGGQKASLNWDYRRILQHIREHFPGIAKIADNPHSTSHNFAIPGHRGNVGVIAAYSRLFCGTCNRIRITPSGILRTCLYDKDGFNIKDALRDGKSDEELGNLVASAIQGKAKDGWESEKKRHNHQLVHESMATIGG